MKRLLCAAAIVLLAGCPSLASIETHKTLANAYVKASISECQVEKLSIRYFYPDHGGGVSAWVVECKNFPNHVFVCREKCFPVYKDKK